MPVLGSDPSLLRPLQAAAPEPDVTSGPQCPQCHAPYDADGYCTQCGAARPNPRFHIEAQPASWLAAVCDRGLKHAGNEDAMAVAATGGRAQIVVCDGVSTAARSAEASTAAADAALAVLSGSRAHGVGGAKAALAAAIGARIDAAADAAADAVQQVTDALRQELGNNPMIGSLPSCTFVAAAVEDDLAVVGSVGDSRGYWLPDDAEPMRLTTDDSWAEFRVAAGASRAEAESGPQSHTITRWLGTDAPDHTPAKTSLALDRPGWLLLCSDGLWNYASEPEALAEVVAATARTVGAEPLALARGLVQWANDQGGRDNITVALARLEPNARRPGAESASDLGQRSEHELREREHARGPSETTERGSHG